jgi:hypothetical protein
MSPARAEDRWEPAVAAERLAEIHADVLDFVGRVDQAVTTGDLYYLVDKAAALQRSVTRLSDLAAELLDEGVDLSRHTTRIEDRLVRTGRLGYRVIRKLHPGASA